MKVLTRLPASWLPVNSIEDLPSWDKFLIPVKYLWEYTEKGSDGRVTQHVILELYQGVWFGYSETIKNP